jgi:hypothetical protein
MPMWIWIAVGVGSFLALSIVASFAIALVLRMIGLRISELYEDQFWTSLPPSRASATPEEQHAGGVEREEALAAEPERKEPQPSEVKQR